MLGQPIPITTPKVTGVKLTGALRPGATATDLALAVTQKLRAQGVEAGVFGDIDLQAHRDWVERVCAAAGLSCHLPLWREARRGLIDELLASGVRTMGVTIAASPNVIASRSAVSSPRSAP